MPVSVPVPALDAKDLLLHRDGVRYPLVFLRKGNSQDRIRTKCSMVIFLALKVQDPPIVYEKGTLKQEKGFSLPLRAVVGSM